MIKTGFVDKLPFILVFAIIVSYSLPAASAMCPLCTASAAIGLGVARYYGIDDIVIGIWLGALAVSTALWVNNIVKKRAGAKFKVLPIYEALLIAAVIAATIVPFYFAGFFSGMPGMVDTIFGINRLVFGIIVGSLVTFIGAPMSNMVKRKRNSVFPYQTIIITFLMLIALSALFWYVTKYYYVI